MATPILIIDAMSDFYRSQLAGRFRDVEFRTANDRRSVAPSQLADAEAIVALASPAVLPRGAVGRHDQPGEAGMKSIHRLLFFVFLAAPAFAQPAATPDIEQAAQRIVRLANDARREHGRPALQTEPRLTDTSRYFAQYMANEDRLGHEADGASHAERALKRGYDYCVVTENIAYEFNSAGFTTGRLAQEFVEGWLKSTGHRANLLDPDVTETGVAVARSARTGRYYAVQMLGRPKSQSIRFQIANRSDATVRYLIDERAFALAPRQTRTHEECRPGEVSLGASGRNVPLVPAGGDRLVIVRSASGTLNVQKN